MTEEQKPKTKKVPQVFIEETLIGSMNPKPVAYKSGRVVGRINQANWRREHEARGNATRQDKDGYWLVFKQSLVERLVEVPVAESVEVPVAESVEVAP